MERSVSLSKMARRSRRSRLMRARRPGRWQMQYSAVSSGTVGRERPHVRAILQHGIVEALALCLGEGRGPLPLVGAAEDPPRVVLELEHEDALGGEQEHVDLGDVGGGVRAGHDEVRVGGIPRGGEVVVERVFDEVLAERALLVGRLEHADGPGHVAAGDIEEIVEYAVELGHRVNLRARDLLGL